MRWWEARTGHGQYLLVYDCGKSAVRVSPGVRAASVHAWALPPATGPAAAGAAGAALPRARTALADPRRLDLTALRTAHEWPCVLHYVTCGAAWLRDKYEALGPFQASWAGLPIAPSFHLDAR